jgi:hypothetical protein
MVGDKLRRLYWIYGWRQVAEVILDVAEVILDVAEVILFSIELMTSLASSSS